MTTSTKKQLYGEYINPTVRFIIEKKNKKNNFIK
jgi:hypothetical protein